MMDVKYKVLLKLVLVLTVLTVLFHLLFNALDEGYYPKYFILVPLCFLFEGFALFAVVGESEKKKELPSPQRQLLLRAIKMVTCILVLIVGILLDREHAVGFSLVFATFYVVYLIVETIEMMKLKTNKKQ